MDSNARRYYAQVAAKPSVLGVSGPLDGSRFNGTLADLQAYSQRFIQGRQALLAQRAQQSA
jgi:hypothetical protein